ncbi:MAG: UPF0149 family protein [Candidatus Sedimenticola endophacoides]
MTQGSWDYERLEHSLGTAGVEEGAAQVHGLLCGLLCVDIERPLERLLGEVMPDASAGELSVQECRVALGEIQDQTREALAGPGFGFAPLLPPEGWPLTERAGALAEWCQGFLYGIGLAGPLDPETLSREAREVLNDLAEITRIDLDALGGDDEEQEQEEQALTEIVEFVRVAVLLLREELIHDRQ